jgi:hypothetical protein
MSGRITVWGASALLTTYFAKTSDPPPSFYLALITDIAPTPYLSGGELDEPEALDYARAEIPNNLLNWANDSSPQEVYNILPISFTTATSDWGMIRYWALCNAPVDGYNFITGELENPVLINTGDQMVFADGDLSVVLGPFFLVEEA